MFAELHVPTLIDLGINSTRAEELKQICLKLENTGDSQVSIWQKLSQTLLKNDPFAIHLYLFTLLFPNWRNHPETASVWLPDVETITKANISEFMQRRGFVSLNQFHHWTTKEYESFWQQVINELNISFKEKPQAICDLSQGYEAPKWLPGARLNIADSCFNAPADHIAIYEYQENNIIKTYTFNELNALANCVANSLIQQGLKPGDAIAIVMPFNHYAVAIYLGIIKMGGMVVSIADSFSSKEISVRLNILDVKVIFTQDEIDWNGKQLPLYPKICDASNANIIVIRKATHDIHLRKQDIWWQTFLVNDDIFASASCNPMAACHILFSSGTTAEPKAIIWNHTTAIKAASDAYFHQNIKPGDVLCWPTNLGWMMGPWLIYAAFINKAGMALYPDLPRSRQFGEFVQNAKVTMLGVVPTLVAAWRESQCMENLDWSAIKVFSSTGECSNAEDMFYLMSLAHYKPVIEYCGGTEIGGSYVSSTVIQANCPSLFSTPVMGIHFEILDEYGKESNVGEVAIKPPSIGLSTELINANHHLVYFENMPIKNGVVLRRHGDLIKRFENDYYAVLGRIDDNMNLGGIKVSAAEIERVLAGMPEISEVAAIAVFAPNQLIIYAAVHSLEMDQLSLKKIMQQRINLQLNPLFKIHDVVLVNELPKTASNKIMRRVLRDKYLSDK